MLIDTKDLWNVWVRDLVVETISIFTVHAASKAQAMEVMRVKIEVEHLGQGYLSLPLDARPTEIYGLPGVEVKEWDPVPPDVEVLSSTDIDRTHY